MSSASSSRLPAGIGGKDTSSLNPNGGNDGGNDQASRLAHTVGNSGRRSRVVVLTSRDVVICENEARQARNEDRADRRHATSDNVSEDEGLLDVPAEQQRDLPDPQPMNTNTLLINLVRDFNALTPASRAVAKAIVGGVATSTAPATQGTAATSSSRAYSDADMKIASSIDNVYEIPQVVISLAVSGLHVPLTLLTASTIEKIHTDPSCITMKKGLVLDDLKKSVLDTSNFPAESTLTPVEFYEASENFLELLNIIAGPAVIEKFKEHRRFCLARRRFTNHYDAVLAFDIETRRLFFNTKTFLSEAAYEHRWNDTLTMVSHAKAEESAANATKEVTRLTALAARFETNSGSSNSHRYQPYPHSKPKLDGTNVSSSTDSKSFRKGKGASADGPLCLICGRNGHKASDCTHTLTVKNSQPVCQWQDKLVLKSSSAIVCISYNIGRCIKARHGDDVIHVCSVCGSKSHAAVARSC
jgi:hypothetical protein